MNKYIATQKLIELDFDMIEAYDAAIRGIDREASQQMLREFREDHRKHTDNLGAILRNYEKEVPDGPDYRRWLAEAKVVIADWLGFNVDVINALNDNSAMIMDAYDRALELDNLDAALQQTLQSNRDDIVRHRQWFAERITQISNATASP